MSDYIYALHRPTDDYDGFHSVVSEAFISGVVAAIRDDTPHEHGIPWSACETILRAARRLLRVNILQGVTTYDPPGPEGSEFAIYCLVSIGADEMAEDVIEAKVGLSELFKFYGEEDAREYRDELAESLRRIDAWLEEHAA